MQNRTTRTYYLKGNIDNTQQNCKYLFNRNSDETVNNIISECRKTAQKEFMVKTRLGEKGDQLEILLETEI